MNIIDIIIIACIALSAIFGFRDGAIRQAGALAAIVIALILAKSFCAEAAALLQIKGENAHIWGYIIVLILGFTATGFIANILSNVVSAVGLGFLDRIAGALFGAIKCILILSLLLVLFDLANNSFSIVDNTVTKSSKLYKPVISTSNYILPAIDWVEDQITNENQ
ncbi:MAG: CvpA family protein [Rikenellaceae bacterium]